MRRDRISSTLPYIVASAGGGSVSTSVRAGLSGRAGAMGSGARPRRHLPTSPPLSRSSAGSNPGRRSSRSCWVMNSARRLSARLFGSADDRAGRGRQRARPAMTRRRPAADSVLAGHRRRPQRSLSGLTEWPLISAGGWAHCPSGADASGGG